MGSDSYIVDSEVSPQAAYAAGRAAGLEEAARIADARAADGLDVSAARWLADAIRTRTKDGAK